jgi:hypothetical protein
MNRRNWKWLGSSLARRFWPLESGSLAQAAQRLTGLEDFGSPDLEPALSALLGSLEQEADLHTLGRLLMCRHLLDMLQTRLRLAAAWQTHRQTLEAVRIKKPVFIVGMPRSGSTFLHELLAEDPAHRAPRAWELMNPVPSGAGGEGDRRRRIRQTEVSLWWFRRLAPRADAVYPMRALTPHECVAIHSYTFLSEEFISTCRIPAYEAFLHQADLTPAYAFEKRFLQWLQLESSDKRWVLKSPDHVRGLEALFDVFPDATIVQTHRNPVEVLKSLADLTRVMRGLFGPPGGHEETRLREARMLAEGTERFLQFRDSHLHLAERFIDVKYTELVARPLATVRRIYEQLGEPLTAGAAELIERLASQRSRYSGPRASAEAADESRALRPETTLFERYCARFGLAGGAGNQS